MSERDNYYILLGLDPEIDDWPSIEKVIGARRSEWSMDASSGSPAKALKGKKALDELGAIRATLRDVTQRRREAGEAQAILEGLKDEARVELRKMLLLRRDTGIVLGPGEPKRFARRVQDRLGPEEVIGLARELGFTVAEPGPKSTSSGPAKIQGLDTTKARQIRQLLDFLGKATLYDFLGPGCSSRTTCAALRRAADAIYLDEHRKANKTPEVTARQDLAGKCKDVFKDEAERRAYDATLAIEAMSSGPMQQLIETAGDDKILLPGEMARLVAEAAERGVGADAARRYIQTVAARRGWAFEAPAEVPSSPKRGRWIVVGTLSAVALLGLFATLLLLGGVLSVGEIRAAGIQLPAFGSNRSPGVDVWGQWVEFGQPLSMDVVQVIGARLGADGEWTALAGPGDYLEEAHIQMSSTGVVESVRLRAQLPLDEEVDLLVHHSHGATRAWWGEAASSVSITQDGCTRWAESYRKRGENLRAEIWTCVTGGFQTSQVTFELDR